MNSDFRLKKTDYEKQILILISAEKMFTYLL